jgi:type II secretory pathway component PulC
MRFIAGLVGVILSASLARAEEPPEAKAPEQKPEAAPEQKPEAARPKVPLRVVRLLPDSNQALLFDRARGTHVLADIGATIEGYLVEDIDDDEVTLSANGAQIVLAAPDQSWRHRRGTDEASPPVTRTAKVVAKADPAPLDPYVEGGDGVIRSVDAPSSIEAGDGGIRTATAPATTAPIEPTALSASAASPAVASALATPAPATATPAPAAVAPATTATPAPTAATPAPALATTAAPVTATPTPAPALAATAAPVTATPTPAPAVVVTAAPVTVTQAAVTVVSPAPITGAAMPTTAGTPAPAADGPVMLGRHDVDVALSDFGRLTASVRGSFTPAGARLDAIFEGSLFAKAGLRVGDVVTSVDGRPLRSLDDAADLYARARGTRAMTLQVVRGGKPTVLRLTIQ